MLELISNNLGTAAAVLIPVAITALAVWAFVRDKKKGKTSCGCGCADCAMSELCRKQK